MYGISDISSKPYKIYNCVWAYRDLLVWTGHKKSLWRRGCQSTSRKARTTHPYRPSPTEVTDHFDNVPDWGAFRWQFPSWAMRFPGTPAPGGPTSAPFQPPDRHRLTGGGWGDLRRKKPTRPSRASRSPAGGVLGILSEPNPPRRPMLTRVGSGGTGRPFPAPPPRRPPWASRVVGLTAHRTCPSLSPWPPPGGSGI